MVKRADLQFQFWEEGTILQNLRDVNKEHIGERADYNSYCGISFLSVVETDFTRVVLREIVGGVGNTL